MLNSIEFSLYVLLEKEPKKELRASLPDIYTRYARKLSFRLKCRKLYIQCALNKRYNDKRYNEKQSINYYNI